MFYKLMIFFSFVTITVFSSLTVYELSGYLDNTSELFQNDSINGKCMLSWSETNGESTYVKAGIWNGSGYDLYTLSEASLYARIINCKINSAGNAIVAWMETDGSNYLVQCSIWNGSSWTKTVLSSNSSYVFNIGMEQSENGRSVIVWYELAPNSSLIIKASYWNGSSWNTQIVDDSGIAYINRFGLSIDENGIAKGCWSYFDFSSKKCHVKSAKWD